MKNDGADLVKPITFAALARTGVPNADLVVMGQDAVWLSAIEVEARRDIGSDGGWAHEIKA